MRGCSEPLLTPEAFHGMLRCDLSIHELLKCRERGVKLDDWPVEGSSLFVLLRKSDVVGSVWTNLTPEVLLVQSVFKARREKKK